MQFKSMWFKCNYTVLFHLREIFCSQTHRNRRQKRWLLGALKVKVAQLRQTLCDPMVCSPPGSSVHGILQARTLGMGCHSLLQGIFPTQRSNPGLSRCTRILYCLSQQGSPNLNIGYKANSLFMFAILHDLGFSKTTLPISIL